MFDKDKESFETPEFARQALDVAMWDQQMQPESKHVPAEITDKIVDFAIDLVDLNKDSTRQRSEELDSAVFYVGSHDVDEKLPTLKITIPKEEVAEQYGWRAELTFGNQDQNLSQCVLVNKDGTIRVSTHNGRPDEFMTADQAANFLSHFEEILPTLVSDIDAN